MRRLLVKPYSERMHPQDPAAGAAPAPTDPMQALAGQLQGIASEAEIAANAERDQEAAELGNPPAQPARQEAAQPAAAEEDTDDDDEALPPEEEGESEVDEGVSAEEEEEEPTPAEPAVAEPKLGRRAAIRELTRVSGELESTKEERERLNRDLDSTKGELANYKAADMTIRQHLQQQSGYVRESNGRFRYENLSEKVLRGTATAEEADEVSQMTQWHEFAAPIYRAAEEMVLGSFAADWKTLESLDGVGADGIKKLNEVPKTVDGIKLLHQMAYAAGQTAEAAKSKATIARLRAEVKSLRTTTGATRVAQPASSNGAAVPGGTALINRMIDPVTGLPNPDFDKEVQAGKWLGVELADT